MRLEIFLDVVAEGISHRKYFAVVQPNLCFRELGHVFDIDDKGTLDAEKADRKESFGNARDGHQCHHLRAVRQVQTQVFTERFDVPYLMRAYTHYATFYLEEEGFIVRQLTLLLLLEQELATHFLNRLLELQQAEGFEQIIDRIDLVTIDGILAVGRREYYQRRIVQRRDKV